MYLLFGYERCLVLVLAILPFVKEKWLGRKISIVELLVLLVNELLVRLWRELFFFFELIRGILGVLWTFL